MSHASSANRMVVRHSRTIAHCVYLDNRKCYSRHTVVCRAASDKDEELRAATEEYAELNEAIEVRRRRRWFACI